MSYEVTKDNLRHLPIPKVMEKFGSRLKSFSWVTLNAGSDFGQLSRDTPRTRELFFCIASIKGTETVIEIVTGSFQFIPAFAEVQMLAGKKVVEIVFVQNHSQCFARTETGDVYTWKSIAVAKASRQEDLSNVGKVEKIFEGATSIKLASDRLLALDGRGRIWTLRAPKLSTPSLLPGLEGEVVTQWDAFGFKALLVTETGKVYKADFGRTGNGSIIEKLLNAHKGSVEATAKKIFDRDCKFVCSINPCTVVTRDNKVYFEETDASNRSRWTLLKTNIPFEKVYVAPYSKVNPYRGLSLYIGLSSSNQFYIWGDSTKFEDRFFKPIRPAETTLVDIIIAHGSMEDYINHCMFHYTHEDPQPDKEQSTEDKGPQPANKGCGNK